MSSKRMKNMAAKMKKRAKNPFGAKTHLKNNATKMSTKMTWPEREFKKLLKELKVEFEVQKIVGSKIFDFYIPHINLLVEVDGDYYHANPETMNLENVNRMQAKNIRNDAFKDSLAIGLGYGIERVWENDLKINYKTVKARFKAIIK